MNLPNIGNPLTIPVAPPLVKHFHSISELSQHLTWWFGTRFSTDTHSSQMLHHKDSLYFYFTFFFSPRRCDLRCIQHRGWHCPVPTTAGSAQLRLLQGPLLILCGGEGSASLCLGMCSHSGPNTKPSQPCWPNRIGTQAAAPLLMVGEFAGISLHYTIYAWQGEHRGRPALQSHAQLCARHLLYCKIL